MVEFRLEDTLWYYKNKDHPIQKRCVIMIDRDEEFNNQFLILDDDEKVKKRILLESIKKVSQYKDKSWEFELESGKRFRFKGLSDQVNQKWYNLIDKIITGYIDDVIESDNEPSEKLNVLKIDQELTTPGLLEVFSLVDSYILEIDNTSISLQNRRKKSEKFVFDFKVIKKFGSTDFCFAIELGRSSRFGTGIIALKSVNYDSKFYYNNLKEQVEKVLYSLAFRDTSYKYENKGFDHDEVSDSETSVSSIETIPVRPTNVSLLNYSIGKNSNKPVNNQTVRSTEKLNISHKDKELHEGVALKINRNDSETDESFYQDKYVPHYMSNKRMLSPANEFFVDEDNSIYGRVKL